MVCIYVVSCFFCFGAWWERERAPYQASKQEARNTLRNSFPDDSGSKLRDKEQQRLSSK